MAQLINGEGPGVLLRDADDHDLPAGFEELHRLVHGLLLSAALKDQVHTEGHLLQYGRHHILPVGVGGAGSPHLPSQGQPLVDLVGDPHRSGAIGQRRQQHAHADGTTAQDGDRLPLHLSGQPHGIGAYGEWLTESPLVVCDPLLQGVAGPFGHDDVLGEASFCLTRIAKELQVAAGMGTSAETLVTLAAGHRGIKGDTVAGLHPRHLLPYSHHLAGSLMACGEGILHHLTADTAGEIIMDVGAAYPHRFHADQHIAGGADHRVRHLTHLHLPEACQLKSFHFEKLSC